jgi:hypothetical protein
MAEQEFTLLASRRFTFALLQGSPLLHYCTLSKAICGHEMTARRSKAQIFDM